MLLDSSDVPNGTLLEFDVCICGGGVAGITLALELSGSGMRICLLESGGLQRERGTQDLYDGRNASRVYADEGESFRDYLRATRSRYLGGSSNCWGGWCRPLDEIDFTSRSWVPHSGWPISRAELAPYYARAHKILKLGPFEYDPGTWQRAAATSRFAILPFDEQILTTEINQFSPPVRFGRDYRDEIAGAANVLAVLHANAVELECVPNGGAVRCIHVRSLSGNRLLVRSRQVVLAAGGIENARLLLASNRHRPAGLGNEHDLVGRYFMEHASIPSGRVIFTKPVRGTEAYDANHFYQNPKIVANGTRFAAHLGISAAEQGRHGLLNSRTYIRSVYAYAEDGNPAVESLRNIYCLASRFYKHRPVTLADLVSIATSPRVITTAILARLTNLGRYIAGYRLWHIVEACPNAQSRVTLTPERDALGMPRVMLDWRPTELQRRTIEHAQRLVDEQLRRVGIGYVEPWLPPGPSWPREMQWLWHHMGTTRMHRNPGLGVVDEDCRVHGVGNLFVAGSSVFPTAGKDTPTLTIVALALRLAEHMKRHPGAEMPA